jgi:sporulation protein YlmC with PRC-barrel domain
MRFSESRSRRVLDTSTAVEIGVVDGFVVDAASRRVHAVRVGKHAGGSILPWGDLQAFGPDAVTVQSDASIREASEPLDAAGDLVGGLVLTDKGFELGRVDDVEFDPETGGLEQLHLGGRSLEAGGLLGAGRYAVVVRHPEDDAPAS